MLLYEKVKQLCDEKHMSIRSLERQANLATGTIVKWKKEISNPTYMTVVAVSKVLGIKPCDLMADEVKKFTENKEEQTK